MYRLCRVIFWRTAHSVREIFCFGGIAFALGVDAFEQFFSRAGRLKKKPRHAHSLGFLWSVDRPSNFLVRIALSLWTFKQLPT